jgi:signal transduction histidine kinase/ActR/RegA family two-component response regulator
MQADDEDELLRSVAIQNAQSILAARQRAEQDILRAKEEVERTSQELAHSLAMMRATLESTWDGILVTDERGNVTGFNERFVQMWQLPRGVMEARQHRQILDFCAQHFNDRGPFASRVEEIYAASPQETFDVLELADGRVFERYSRVQVVDAANVGRVWSFRDMTEHRRAQEALRDESRLLELLNKTGSRLSSELDLQALVQAVTDAATELSGARFGAFFYNVTYPNGDAYMLHALSGAPREAFEQFGQPRATPLLGPTFRGEGPTRCDDVLQDARYGTMPPHWGMPAGHLPVRSYLAVPVISRTGKVLGGLFFGHPERGVFSERTERLVVGVAAQAAVAIDNARLFEAAQQAAEERKHLLESERSARREADRASAMKDDFLAILSHELRTPLSAILGWSQVLRARTMSAAELRQGLEIIERNARMQTQLIEDLLDMSRITSGRMRLDTQPVDLVSVIEAAMETVRPAAEAKAIRLTKLLDLAAGPIIGDPDRLQQVVWNLLSNAIKFTGKNGRVEVRLERVNSQIEITVADTGIGIAAEFLPHVFDRFRQADPSRMRTAGGLGLGLSIVKHLVEQHGGKVQVASPGEGGGATFTVCLPLTVVVHRDAEGAGRVHPEEMGASASDFRRSNLAGIRVLVVDDQADARELIKRVLEECHAEVLTAGAADEALRAVERDRPDVLVSDIGMPDVDGYELLRRVRGLGHTRGGGIPAIALTAFARSEDRTSALRAGFLVHVSKPVEPSELVATVASVVGRTGEAAAE